MKVLITGASGLIGKRIRQNIKPGHITWVALSRKVRKPEANTQWIQWDALQRSAPWDEIGPVDGIINLMGEGIADKRWSPTRKKLLVNSRVLGTDNLLKPLEKMNLRPQWYLGASAVGFYGIDPPGICSAVSPPGKDFLGQTCIAWERAHERARSLGMRVAVLRIGLVLDPSGGLLKKMSTPFKLGLGGPLGDGHQGMSWIHIEDLVRIFAYLLDNPVQGAFNGCTPGAVSNRVFSQVLAKTLGRPCFFAAPALVLRLVFGEMAQAILGGQLVVPEKLQNAGFQFHFPDLEKALKNLLNK